MIWANTENYYSYSIYSVEEHERLYGPIGAQPPPYSLTAQDPPRAAAQRRGRGPQPTRQPYPNAQPPPNPPALHVQTPTVEQPPPYTDTIDEEEPPVGDTVPILQHPG